MVQSNTPWKKKPQDTGYEFETNQVFAVYGSLMRGLGNHQVIDRQGNAFLYETQTADTNYRMLSLGGFPAVGRHHAGTAPIELEVYRVAPENIGALDALEGNGTFYQREQVDIIIPDEHVRGPKPLGTHVKHTRKVWLYLLKDFWKHVNSNRYDEVLPNDINGLTSWAHFYTQRQEANA